MPTVRTNDIETYYELAGDGPVVVFVHASMLDHSVWDAQAAALRADHTTLVYDLRGHGRTGGSQRASYTIDLFVDDLDALLDALSLDSVVLCGLSMGGLIAECYATRHPERVVGLVLAETWTPPVLGASDWLVRRVVLPATVLPVRLFGIERVERANVWLTERFARGAGGDYAAIQRLRRDAPPMATAEFTKVVGAMTRFHRTTVDLSALTMPTLVLVAANGLPFVRRHAARIAASADERAGVSVETVPDAGHAVTVDAPDVVTDAIRGLLTRIESVPGPGDTTRTG
ncbi:alpha/beta fold hydrolase [Salinirubrum litoreum]|uniref:Alpha/beta fold hydrolase n=1 Tax=Salinirubrum litoreum TaxID=1126234 RepID=A0ABD5R8A0_9EURY|nr:alpha/beta hydrolase [Salinirubrum litoreum]